jgi:hypothetical protein
VQDPVPPSSTAAPATRGAALATALAALDALATLGEDVEDEWTYVTALAEAGRTRLRAAAGPDPDAPLAAHRAAAVAAAADEVGRISDPHRAIDWLSTFPAIVDLALAAEPAGAATAADSSASAADSSASAASAAPGGSTPPAGSLGPAGGVS